MTFYADVAFNDPIGDDAVLTYHLGRDRDIPELGSRVVCRVNTRFAMGYIIRIHRDKPNFRTVPLGRVIDPVPLFSKELIELAKITARVCVANVGEVLHAMLPGGIKQDLTRQVLYKAEPLEDEVDALEPLAYLKEKGEVSYRYFADTFSLKDSKINSWITKGYLSVVQKLTEKAAHKTQKTLLLSPDVVIEETKLTPKEKAVIEALFKMSVAPTKTVLAKAADTSFGPINQLIKKGILTETLEQIVREVGTEEYYDAPAELPPELTDEQKATLEKIQEAYDCDMQPVLIRGVTCCGKTEIYLRWVAEVLAEGRSAIVLVPEISLTPQMMKRFRDRFGKDVAIMHSKLSQGERFDQWELIRQGKRRVVVGARSAVFAPAVNLGTIILDEEGEPSFKQADSPRYNARDVALERCRLESAQLVMGSATPTIDAYAMALNGDFVLCEMNNRVSSRKMPEVEIVDMRHELSAKNNRSMFSGALREAMQKTLKEKKQAILFLNRRGYSSFVFCRECGDPLKCDRCNVSLVYHSGNKILRCHYCGLFKENLSICPSCGSNKIKYFGTGTQRVEQEAARYFPGAKIARLDSDTTKLKGSLERILDDFGKGKADILIGTQMVAKGLDFPNVTLVGVLAADSLLRVPDFRASERNFSLLAQVSGRAGRGDAPGRVILQTYSPEHPSVTHAATEDYAAFYDYEINARREANFPPFCNLAAITVSAEKNENAKEAAFSLVSELTLIPAAKSCEIFGPVPAAIERINNRYRWQIMIKEIDLALLTSSLAEALKNTKRKGSAKIDIDINPYLSA
ncbi:MAG: primosomal protein N' [Candidatus Riflebacteria bacterium]|nr:primosomal protein N' [Candidatus Riflebacteria bacterium]